MTRRLLRWLHEYGGDALVLLVLVSVVLTILWFSHPDTQLPLEFGRLRDVVDLSGKVLTLIVGTVAAIAAYRRFFKGRLLDVRLRMRLSSKPVRWLDAGPLPLQGEARALLHAVDLEIENVGAAVLFDPQVTLKVRTLDANVHIALDLTSIGIEEPRPFGALDGISPGEVVVYHYHFRIIDQFPAFRVSAQIEAPDGSAWARSITVANLIAPSDSERVRST